jgi:hypothetical protein
MRGKEVIIFLLFVLLMVGWRGRLVLEALSRPSSKVIFPLLSVESNLVLETIFLGDKIEMAVTSSDDGSKCLGPGRFNFAFIKEFWGVLRNDFRIFFDQFHANGCIPKYLLYRGGRKEVPVSILQYADDTLCIGEASIENLWTLKALLRGFEMVSGLK